MWDTEPNPATRAAVKAIVEDFQKLHKDIEVRAEGLIGVGGISTGNIGIVGTANRGPIGQVHILGSYSEALDLFCSYDRWSTTGTPLMVLVGRMDEGMSHLILLSVPLFVFLGLLIEMTGMARAMVSFLASLLGHVRGGLSYVLLGAMILVSGISGAKAADMAAVGPVLFPEMKKRGAKGGELVSLLAASGAISFSSPGGPPWL